MPAVRISLKESSNQDVDELNGDTTFINILSDIGSTSILSVSMVHPLNVHENIVLSKVHTFRK